MDYVEKATLAFLTSLKVGEVKAFPNGRNEFPDFSIGSRIGVECTRLVHQVQKNGQWYILDELQPRIIHGFEGVIISIQSSGLSGSYFVCLDFDIEIDLRAAQKTLRQYLLRLSKLSHIVPHRLQLLEHLRLEIISASGDHGSKFLVGAINSIDGGGFVLDQLSKQTKDAIERKTRQLLQKRELFKEWWLAVSGPVSVSVSEDYVQFVTAELAGKTPWDRVLLVDASVPERSKVLDLSCR